MIEKNFKRSNFFIILTIVSSILILGIYIFISFYQNEETKNKSFALDNNEIEKLKKSLSDKNKEINDLKKEIKNLKNTINITKANLKLCKKEKEELIKNKSSKFFKFLEENKDFPKEVIDTVKNYCLKGNTLNIGCSVYVLRDKFGLSYKEERDDKLKGIKEFLEDKGGDCEDWSFFFMQLINYFKENENVKYLKILVKDDNEKVMLYKENNYEYILKNFDYIEEDISLLIPTVACYKVDKERGHCQLAFLNGLNPLNSLKGFIIEPQNGIYEGNVEGKNNIYKINGNKKKEIYLLLNNKFWFKEWGFWLSN